LSLTNNTRALTGAATGERVRSNGTVSGPAHAKMGSSLEKSLFHPATHSFADRRSRQGYAACYLAIFFALHSSSATTGLLSPVPRTAWAPGTRLLSQVPWARQLLSPYYQNLVPLAEKRHSNDHPPFANITPQKKSKKFIKRSTEIHTEIPGGGSDAIA